MNWLISRKYILWMGLNCVMLTLWAYPVLGVSQIDNPIAADDFGDLVVAIAEAVRQIALPLAMVALVISGFRFILAAGNEAKLKEARKMITWVLVGTAIVVGASVLAEAVVNIVKNLNT